MADKALNGLTAATSIGAADLLYLENAGGNSRKITGANAAIALGALTLIEEYSGNGSTGTKTFSSIPSTFRALRLDWLVRSSVSATSANLNLQINGDTSAIYDRQHLSATATTPAATESLAQTSATVGIVAGDTSASGCPGTGQLTICDYAATVFNKHGESVFSYKTSNSSGGFSLRLSGFEWRSTAAISSLTLALSSGNYMTGSKLRLYGIA